MSERRHSGKYNLLMSYLLQAANFIFPLITFPYVSRTLGAAAIGEVSFASSIANYFAAIATFGLNTYAIRACSSVRDNKKELERTAGELFSANVVTTIFAVVLFIGTVFMYPKFCENHLLFLISGMGFATEFLGMTWLYIALEQFTYITVRTVLIKTISVICILFCVKESSDVITYAFILSGVVVLTNVLNFFYSKRLLHLPLVLNRQFLKHYKVTCWFFMQSVALTLFNNMDISMIGLLNESAQVGYYEIAAKIKWMASILVSTLGSVFLPRLSQAYEDESMTIYWSTVNKCLSYNLFISLPIATYVFYAGNELITFFAGEEYIAAGIIIKILIACIVFISVSTITGSQVLISMKKEKSQFASIVLGGCVNFILNLIIIPKYGAIGAACTTLLTEIVIVVYQFVALVRIKVQLHLWNAIKKPFLGCVCASGVCFVVHTIANLTGVYKLFIGGPVFVATYIGIMWLMKDVTLLSMLKIICKDKIMGEK